MKSLKSTIENLVFERKVTHKEVYNYLGLSPNAYYTMMRVNNMKTSTLEKLCKYFDLKICFFFDDCTGHDCNEEKLDLLSLLNQEEKAQILDILLKHSSGLGINKNTPRIVTEQSNSI